MASIIRIKRSSVSGNPTTLAAGELAYSGLTDNGSNGGDRLYIGLGTETAGNAANHIVIGGKYFTDMLDHTAGTLTASSALIVDADKKLDDFYVDNLQLNGNTISSTNTNGDINITPNGTGKTVITSPYIGDSSTSLAEYIYDTVGGAITAGTGITITNSDGGNTSTVSITNTAVTAGSYGSASAIPVLTINAQGQVTAASTASVASSLSIAGDSGTDTVALLSDTLTFAGGTGITSTVTNNSVDFSIDSTVATLTGTQTLTNKTISGASNTLTNIGNSSLTNSKVTIGSTDVSLGATVTSFTGLSSVTSTSFVGELTGNAATATKLATARTISLSGDVSGSVSFDGSGNADISATIQANSVALGTDTTGNYIATIAGTTNQVSVSGSGSESAAVTLSLPQNIHSGATPTFAGMSLSGNLAMGSNTITGLADPVNAQDAATKAYVDAARAGLDVKQSVRVATTANITLSGTQTIDGIALSVGDRVLVKNQSTATQNGIYVVASSTWSRAADADEPNEVSPGLFLFVEEGTLNADNGYVITSDAPLTVGTDAITFTQFSGAGMIVAGNALTKTGNTLDVAVAASGGIEITSDALQLKSSLAGDGLTYSSGVLNVVGTSNRITINADSIDISSSYVGQNTITTLGTITSGTWNADVIADAYIANNLTISGGTVDNTPIGGSTRSSGAFTTLSANSTLGVTGATTLGSTLGVTGNVTLSANLSGSGTSVLSGFDIDGGTYA